MTGKERREQLLGIGRHLFAERGFEGTSIEEIAAQAGVSKPVVYEHFGGKEGLYAVVVDREVERLLTMATSLLGGDLLDRGSLEPALGEQPPPDVEQLLPPFLAGHPLAAGSWRVGAHRVIIAVPRTPRQEPGGFGPRGRGRGGSSSRVSAWRWRDAWR